MKIKKLLKNTIICTVCFASSLIMNIPETKAVLQSNGNEGARYNINDWIINVRKMEQLGGAMGLAETFNSNLTSSSASNNIDVHMQKNTEYGAMAILSASSYGNPNTITDGQTTTGNVTGAVMKINKEWVSAGTITGVQSYSNANGRYKNVYGTTYVAKSGDAIEGVIGWHGSTASQWLINTNYAGLIRAYSGSIFSYYGYGYMGSGSYRGQLFGDAAINRTWSSRAVIVQGEGI